MRRKKAKPHIEVKCDWCGSMTDRFVVNLEHKRFCRHQYVGFPPEKDCMEDYIRSKNVRKKEEQKESLFNKQEEQLCEKDQEEKKKIRAANLAKLEAYSRELSRKKYEKKI